MDIGFGSLRLRLHKDSGCNVCGEGLGFMV